MVLMKLLLVACVLFAVETRGGALSLRSAVEAAAATGALPDGSAVEAAAATGALPDEVFCIMQCPSSSVNCPGHCRNCENGSTRWGSGWGLCGVSDLEDLDTKFFYTSLFASMCDPNLALPDGSAVEAAAATGALPDEVFCIMQCPSSSVNCPGHCRNCENGSTRWGRGSGWGLCGVSDLDTKFFYTSLFASMCDPNFNSLDGDAETGIPDDPVFDDFQKYREEHPNEDPTSR
jgi:hypothetical protein